MRASIGQFGENGAHLVCTEWSAVIAELVVERRSGQQAELFRRTSWVIEDWEAELIPDYLAHQASMEEAVSGSGLELEQRVQGWKHQELLKRKQRKKQRAQVPVSSAPTRDVGPQETNAQGRRQQASPPPNKVRENQRQEHTTSREHLPEVDIPALMERACAEREATFLARIEGLMREHLVSQTISPVRSSSPQPAAASEQEEQQSGGHSRPEAAEAAGPSERVHTRLDEPAKHPVQNKSARLH
jgi:hypothetical protein